MAVWAVWAIVILVVGAVLALAATGVWVFAVLLALLAIGIGLGLRFAGTLGETGRMRRFRGQARGAGPDADPDVKFTDRDRETLAS